MNSISEDKTAMKEAMGEEADETNSTDSPSKEEDEVPEPMANNLKETVNGEINRAMYCSPEKESELDMDNLFINATLTPPKNKKPTHTSAPSMVLTNINSKPATKNNGMSSALHSRTFTPHTESLMSLFARPMSGTPLTPTVPEDSAFNEDGKDSNSTSLSVKTDNPFAGPPPLPDFIKNQNENQKESMTITLPTTPRRSNNNKNNSNAIEKENIEQMKMMKDVPLPGLLSREITPTTQNLRKTSNHHTRQRHNRDDTAMANNLSRENTPYDDDDNDDGDNDKVVEQQQFLRAVANVNEKTRLLSSSSSHITRNSANNYHQSDPENTKIISAISMGNNLKQFISDSKICDTSTLIGAFLFALFQLVFFFAEASAITRPSRSNSDAAALLSPMALIACMGSLVTSPMLIAVLGGEYPALYPCLDLFMAPFLAQMAVNIDEVLVQMQVNNGSGDSSDDTAAFLATFVALNAFGMLLTGLLCVLAGKVKLANLAGFLPYPVLAGFFASVGISVWMIAFKVDTGITVQKAMASGGMSFLSDLARHSSSVVAGVALYILRVRGPHYLIGVIAATVVFAYTAMFLTGTSLHDAQEMSFFWKKGEVMMTKDQERFVYGPPSAFGLWSPAALKKICWPAFKNGLGDVVAMSVIYLLRCSLHAGALKKCAAKMRVDDSVEVHPLSASNGDQTRQSSNSHGSTANNTTMQQMEQGYSSGKKKQKPRDLMTWYASQFLVLTLSGGFVVLPAIALGGIFAKIGAKSRSPQYAAMILVLGCYVSDFWICSYVPKCTFSSLLVLAAIDLIDTWFIKSYQKSATEWIVVPIIVITSLLSGMLQSVGVGLAVSTLIFVASFYRAGVVKFIANGLTIRSTIERNCEDNQWLDQNADMIQVLVLQNYLFFGNANSTLKYVQSMFDDEADFDAELPPIPKYVILDLSIVTGIDTSAVDILADISSLCKQNKCHLILAGIPRIIRPALTTAGVRPSVTNKHLSFSPDLEAALGKSEDDLLKNVGHNEQKAADAGAQLRHRRRVSMVDHGLRHALYEIDSQHNLSLAIHLQILEKSTTPIEINAGDKLNDVGQEHNLPRGLYFIEAGLLRCEHDSSASLTRGRTRSGFFVAPHLSSATDSIGQVNARSGTVGRAANFLKNNPGVAQEHVFRLARVGPGWVIGSISEFMGQDIPGTYTALTPCRVHHLPFETIEEFEVEKPVLILHLYKLLSHLAARRQEMTIGQLATLRSIMSATAPTKPISRSKMRALNQSL